MVNNFNPYIAQYFTKQKQPDQTMKFGKPREYNKRTIFFKNHAQNEVERLVPDLFLLLEKTFLRSESKWFAT